MKGGQSCGNNKNKYNKIVSSGAGVIEKSSSGFQSSGKNSTALEIFELVSNNISCQVYHLKKKKTFT